MGSRTIMAVFCFWVIFRGGICCDRGWYQYGDHCYLITSVPRTKTMSRLLCLMEGSDLISISDNETLDYIAQQVTSVQGDRFWVGLHRSLEDGTLMWLNGEKGDQPWVESKMQPNSGDHIREHITSCFVYNGTVVLDYPCFTKLRSICGHLKQNKTGPMMCHWGVDSKDSFLGERTGRCLFRISVEVTRDKVDVKCREFGALFLDLDGVMLDGLSAFYDHRILTNDGQHYWTGLMWNGTNVFWSSGKPLGEEFPIPLVNGSGSCITVQFNFSDVLETHLFLTDCDDRAAVLCTRDPSLEPTRPATTTKRPVSDAQADLKCPTRIKSFPIGTWKALEGHCYWETSYETKHLSWYEAERFCQTYPDGHLASFHSLDEEKVGLSFQHGKFSHPYWIGLTLDVDTETYRWSDGTPLNYSNWAPNHPDHRDKSLRCVAMNAKETHWVSSLCGVHSWFVCKVPKRPTWPEQTTVLQPTLLQPCYENNEIFYFEDSCYFVMLDSVSWHRAKQYCENEGASMVSVHSYQELEFLLRLLNVATDDYANGGNRVWLGLNSLGSEGVMRWTDWTPVEFVYWNKGEPNNHLNQEKCCSMDIINGFWSDENCNAPMGFICKRRNDTSTTVLPPSTPNPHEGNCKKGWITHHDRCYYLSGFRKKDRVNFSEALQLCNEQGAYLTSIRDEKDQTFLAYLLQSLKVDAWIGLHDTIQSGRYYWVDNSDMQYTNWAPGEPSHSEAFEDCVKMVYDSVQSGLWRDDTCDLKFGYICHATKDSSLPEPSYDRGIDCLNHEGWLKLDGSCYKMFGDNFLTWDEAETTCQREGGHLVSVFDKSVKAVVNYLATEVNSSFWIGLQYKELNHRVGWLNGWPMEISFWEKNEPSNLREDNCFVSTLEGYWKKFPCKEVQPFLCQITTGKPIMRKVYTGNCPAPSTLWSPGVGNACYSTDNETRVDFFGAMLQCYRYGSHLVSIHSIEEMESLKKRIKPGTQSLFIGLFKNSKGGFHWTDDTAVDFVNWDENEPETTKRREEQCVEMMANTLKWRVSTCSDKKSIVCKENKDTLYYEDGQSAKRVEESESGLSVSSVAAIVILTSIALMILLAVTFYYSRNRPRHSSHQESVSFENALYNVDSASMEFHDEREIERSSHGYKYCTESHHQKEL